MTNRALITVVVPCYNQAGFLNETLETVQAQTYNKWECIIVNDGSTDSTKEVALKWLEKDTRFKYIEKENGGLSSARNTGIKISRGEYILPLDADDKIHINLLKEVCEVFKKHNADVVHYNTEFFGVKSGLYKLPEYSYKTLLMQNCFIACTPFKKSGFEKINGYDENLKSFEDWDFWIRLLNKDSKVVKIEKTLYYYRKHPSDSLTNQFAKNPKLYYGLYDYIYSKNKAIYDMHFKNPILAYQENESLRAFNHKVKNTMLFKVYGKLKKLL